MSLACQVLRRKPSLDTGDLEAGRVDLETLTTYDLASYGVFAGPHHRADAGSLSDT